jgi:rhamnose utilization protein RhaD (predicted bifunctional aldolase and dehydrogenase)
MKQEVMPMLELREQLIDLAHELGREERELAILGEGNVSALCGDGTFWIKASGGSMGALGPEGVTRVQLGPVLELIERDEMGEEEIEAALLAVRTNAGHRKPSVETFLHALCLSEGGAAWVAHTHAVAINRILCSRLGTEPFRRHLFPDAIVVCGKVPATIPYVDPGFALAKAVKAELGHYRLEHGQPPRLLLMANHGPVALGRSARDAFNIMLMADKWARILWGCHALGGPNFLPDEEAERIDLRLDEHYRRRQLDAG